jgi:hypothetical protein
MKSSKMLARLAALAALSAAGVYAQLGNSLVSIQPLVTETEAVLDDGLIGDWGDIKISRGEGNEYEVSPFPMRFRLFRIGNELFADIYASYPLAVSEVMSFSPPQLPTHSIARIQNTADELQVDFFTAEARDIFLKANDSPHVTMREGTEGDGESYVLLTGSSGELRQFVLRYSQTPGALGDGYRFTRATTAQELEQEILGCQGGLSRATRTRLSFESDCLNHWSDWVLRPWLAEWWRLSATSSVSVEYRLESRENTGFELTTGKGCTGFDPKAFIFSSPVQAMRFRSGTPGASVALEFGLGTVGRGSLPPCVEEPRSPQTGK